MKLKSRARYALRAMIEIARSSKEGKPASLEKIASRTGISRRYLEHLVVSMRKDGLVNSVRGRRGGYMLACAAREIRLGQIIEAVIGPVNIVDCVRRPELCLIADVCECREIYQVINDRVLQALNAYSLADLASRKKHRAALSGLAQLDGDSGQDLDGTDARHEACKTLCSSR